MDDLDKNYVLQNFPFLEDDFDALTDYELFCKGFEYLDNEKLDKDDLPDTSSFITKDVNNLTYYYDKDTMNILLGEKANVDDLSEVATTGSYNDLTDKPTIPDVSNFITKDVNDLTYYTLSSDLKTVATTGSYDDLINKPTIPDVSNFITKDVDDLTNYTTSSTLNSLLANKEDLIEKGSNTNGNYLKFSDGTMICYNTTTVENFAISSSYGSLYQGSLYLNFPISFVGNNPSGFCGKLQYGTSASWGIVRETSLTQIRIRGFDAYSRDGSEDTQISWLAIGTWK